jgi:ABC-type lipoprotein export system ATPase subunit
MNRDALLQQPLPELLKTRPWLRDFFAALGISTFPRTPVSLGDFLNDQPAERLAQFALDPISLTNQCLDFITRMEAFQAQDPGMVREVTVTAGRDKNGRPEAMDLHFRTGEVVSVVGPTGSGKSRLLADIECLAQGDTPSGRRVLLDGRVPDEAHRLSGEQQLVAQLSQNMNFVMDLTVKEFVRMHAESRLVADVDRRVETVFSTAVDLAGEPFTPETPVTALSGGQSRALMIADVACLSASPIVLIDEIENAGVDRRRALELLVKEEKIVLMATHDPLLALSGDRRIVIRNGGVADVLETGEAERQVLARLTGMDRQMARLREQLRAGKPVMF